MKRINIILLFIIISFQGIAFFVICGYTYKSKKFELEQKAKEAFINALDHLLKNRHLEKTLKFDSNGISPLSAVLPDSVCIGNESGMHWYRLDPQKHLMNITSDTSLRLLHSYIFEKNPINTDSLRGLWKDYLGKYDGSIKLALSISVMDEEGKVKSNYTSQSEWCTASNLVFTIYIGYACEIEVLGFINYSIWSILGWWPFVYLLFYAFSILVIYAIMLYTLNKIKSLCQVQIKEIHIPVFVKEDDRPLINPYVLRDNFIFYAEQRIIEVDGKKKKMPLQACMLLELFLNSKDYIVTYDEIMNQLWPDGSGHIKRVHKAVARLRSYLAIECPIHLVRENADSYQLLV